MKKETMWKVEPRACEFDAQDKGEGCEWGTGELGNAGWLLQPIPTVCERKLCYLSFFTGNVASLPKQHKIQPDLLHILKY